MFYVTLETDDGVEWVNDFDVSLLDAKDRENGVICLFEVKGKGVLEELKNLNPYMVGNDKALISTECKGITFKLISHYPIITGKVCERGTQVTLLMENYGELKKILQAFTLNFRKEVKVKKVVKPKIKSLLSPNQEHVLRVALEAGFFDFPRRTSLEELSRRLGVSSASLSESIRRAEKNAIKAFLETRVI